MPRINNLIVHKVDVSHARLVELTRLADQAKPFYDWIENQVKIHTGSHKDLNEILYGLSETEIKNSLLACINSTDESKPFLFDGIGRVYTHPKACFYFFAWIIRDAPQQRLAPLIARMRRLENVTKIEAEVDTLAKLIYEYRGNVKSFSWITIREVIIDRLEGSRRSIKGHNLEILCRTALVTAFQTYFQTHNNYGKYKKIEIPESQIKLGTHTFDLSVKLKLDDESERLLLVPIKTRETEGGGHAHLFSRDVVTAVTETRKIVPDSVICLVIVAKNWSLREIEGIKYLINNVFYFDANPNSFEGFDDDSQIKLNLFIQELLDGKN
jgi:hypothetical protein